jgi:surface protein
MADTSNITDMANMFSNCSSLTALNMSNLKISDTTNTENMFENCTLLELSNINMTGCSEDTIRIITEAYNTSR